MNIENPPHLPAVTADEPAWERRSEIGFFSALFQTIYSVLFFPKKTFSNLKTTGSIFPSLSFYLLLTGATFILRFIIRTPQILKNPLLLGPHVAETYQSYPILAFTGAFFLQTLFFLIFITISVSIIATLWHLSLKIIKGANKPFEATFRLVCYLHGPLFVIFSIISSLMIQYNLMPALLGLGQFTAGMFYMFLSLIHI